jgi:hypothetical protein
MNSDTTTDTTTDTVTKDKKTTIQFLSNSKKKKNHFVLHPIFIIDSKGRLLGGLLDGYGEKYATVTPINAMKKKVFNREELVDQGMKLYVNPEDETDVIIVSQQLTETIQEHAALSYKDRKK